MKTQSLKKQKTKYFSLKNHESKALRAPLNCGNMYNPQVFFLHFTYFSSNIALRDTFQTFKELKLFVVPAKIIRKKNFSVKNETLYKLSSKI